MFGRKKLPVNKKVSADFEVIPQEFYGAKDPVVHYQNEADKVMKNKNVSHQSSFFLLDFLKNKKTLLIVGIVVFIAIVGGIVWYYLWDAGIIKKTETSIIENVNESTVVNQVDIEMPSVEENNELVSDVVTTTTLETTTTSDQKLIDELSNQEIEINFPRVVFTNSVDLDSDSLTDIEEEIFGTDSGNSDTDEDGYYDGQEINNLYNPKGVAPVKLIDSGLIAEYTNPTWQYRIYYSINWQVGEVDDKYQQVLFSNISGDYIEVLVFQKDDNESFNDWFANKAVGQKITDLQNFKNRFQEEGQKRQDNLVNYFMRGNNIYIIIYHPANENGFVSYRQVVQMMVQSFRPNKTVVTIPEQTILPAEPTQAEIEDIFADSIINNNESVNIVTNTAL